MQIIKKKDYVEIDINYNEIEEYKEILKIIELKSTIQNANLNEDILKIKEEIENSIREKTKEWLGEIIENSNWHKYYIFNSSWK